MRIILHAGMHKTGSTAIQRAFCAQPIAGLATPGGPRLNQSDDVQLLFQQGAALEKFRAARYGHLDAARLARWRDEVANRWRAALASCTAPVFLITAEDLSAPDFGPEALHRLAGLLQSARPDARVQVLAYVRPPVSFMQSAYQQRVKEGKRSALDLDPLGLWPGYRARLEKFDTVFGPDAVTLRAFDPAGFPGGDVVADMAAFLGVPALVGGLRANDGFSLQAMAVAYARQAGSLPDDFPSAATAARFRALPARALAGFGGGKFAFSADFAAPALANGRDDLAWIERRIGRPMGDAARAESRVGGPAELLAIALDSRDALAAYVADLPAPPAMVRLRDLASRLRTRLTRREPTRSP